MPKKIWHLIHKDGTTVDIDMTNWSFSVIYSVDCVEDEDVAHYAPPEKDAWEETEGDEQYEFSHLEGEWEKGHHRKWAGIGNLFQFERFLTECDLEAEDVETMGSIGTPGFGMGWAPAISFKGDDPGCIRGAYVTPLIPKSEAEPVWEDVRQAVIKRYKEGVPTWMDNEGWEE